jgi:hypothetical protein
VAGPHDGRQAGLAQLLEVADEIVEPLDDPREDLVTHAALPNAMGEDCRAAALGALLNDG